MAQHIDSIASSSIPRVTKAEFYDACKPGMPIFCEGQYPISLGIEKFTHSPFSHVATLFYISEVNRWALLEATKDHGVHIGHLDYYVDRYDGNLVLCATPILQPADYFKLLQSQFDLVDDSYDTRQEVSMVVHRFISAIPVDIGKKEFFCSGLYEQGRRATSAPLVYNGPGMASPEQVWCDPSIVPVCALIK